MFTCAPSLFAQTGQATDPFFSSVQALLHFNGTNGGTTFTDVTGRTWTRTGGAQTSTAQFKWGGASLLLDGVGDFLSTADSASLELGSHDFTIEAWIMPARIPSSAQYMGIVSKRNTSTEYSYAFILDGDQSGKVRFLGSSTGSNTFVSALSNSAPTANQWSHVAVVRNGSGIVVYLNGVGGTSGSAGTTAMFNNSISTTIGRMSQTATTTGDYSGYIDDVRITIGVARYTANFTPPLAQFQDS